MVVPVIQHLGNSSSRYFPSNHVIFVHVTLCTWKTVEQLRKVRDVPVFYPYL